MNNSTQQNGISRRTFLGSTVKSAALLSTLPTMVKAIGTSPVPKPTGFVLVYDEFREDPTLLQQPSRFYNCREYESCARGEFKFPILEGQITKIFSRQHKVPVQEHIPGLGGHPSFSYPTDEWCVVEIPVCRLKVLDCKEASFEKEYPDKDYPFDFYIYGNPALYAVGKHAKVEVLTARITRHAPPQYRFRLTTVPLRIWVEEKPA
jgi:hypothetical protein